ncbi:MAG: putative toxin-antitoxin system toxin component, PIN family [Salinivirgaceae bacterium]|nr:putative toxin-antitoxin system toxin component, PIN family [Salinivirgaceae bacterium]
MIHAVIDTNVLVSALLSKSDTSIIRQLISCILEGKIITLYHSDIITEYQEVLSRDKFRFAPELVEAMISIIKEHGIDSERIPYDAIMPDEDDRIFYEVTLSKEDAYLVTGNQKHFPKTPVVVTPAEMLAIIEGSR